MKPKCKNDMTGIRVFLRASLEIWMQNLSNHNNHNDDDTDTNQQKRETKAVMEEQEQKKIITKGKLSFSLSLNRQPKRKRREELFSVPSSSPSLSSFTCFFYSVLLKMLLVRLVTFEGNQNDLKVHTKFEKQTKMNNTRLSLLRQQVK